MTNSGEPADYSAYNLEYRSAVDDAWYSVLVILKDHTLTVKLFSFPDSFDETFNAADFVALEAVDELFKRFRPVSDQVQDTDCYRITKNMTVCATVASKNKDDIRYYDAFVKDVSILILGFCFSICFRQWCINIIRYEHYYNENGVYA